jgi:acetyl esterase/lipase
MDRRSAFQPTLSGLEVRVTPSTSVPAVGSIHAVREISNLVYTDSAGTEKLNLYIPEGPAPAGGWPAILALPGGGWRWTNPNDMATSPSVMAKYGYVVATANYAYASSKLGTHIWPADFLDVSQAVRWLRENADRYHIDPNAIVAWGESAGGQLATLLGTGSNGAVEPGSTAPDQAGSSQGISARVEAVVDFYGPTDLLSLYAESRGTRPYLETFLGGAPDQVLGRYVAASPSLNLSPDDPPVLIFQGTADPTVHPDQAAEFAADLQAEGIPHQVQYLPGVPHGFGLSLDHGQVNLVPEILTFLNTALNHPPSS